MLIDMQKEIDDNETLCASHEQLIEQVQKELQDSKDQAKANLNKETGAKEEVTKVWEI